MLLYPATSFGHQVVMATAPPRLPLCLVHATKPNDGSSCPAAGDVTSYPGDRRSNCDAEEQERCVCVCVFVGACVCV